METPLAPLREAPSPLKKRNPLLLGCGGLLLVLALLAATAAGTIWWMQRPITPVVLSESEKAVVEQKIKHLGMGSGTQRSSAGSTIKNQDPTQGPPITISPSYIPGSKVLKLTDREANGLLNLNSDLGKMVRIEFAQDAIHAYFAIPIPEDFPIGAGMVVRARGRFKVSIGPNGTPYAILDDITLFGISLPKAWLGGIKGENLLGEAMGGKAGMPVFGGIKSLHAEPGALVLEVQD